MDINQRVTLHKHGRIYACMAHCLLILLHSTPGDGDAPRAKSARPSQRKKKKSRMMRRRRHRGNGDSDLSEGEFESGSLMA